MNKFVIILPVTLCTMNFADAFLVAISLQVGTSVVMYRAWLGLKALAWAWLWWARALEILSQARIQGLPKPEAWLRLKPGLVYHI